MMSDRADHRAARDSQHADIDLLSTVELVELINDEDARVAPGGRRGRGRSSPPRSTQIVERLRRGGRLVYVGAGTSGRLAVVDAAECGPTFGLPDGRVLAIIAGGVARTRGGAGGGRGRRVRRRSGPRPASASARDDAVVALSASGTHAVRARRRARGRARGRADGRASSASEDSELGRLADHAVVTVVGPEVIAGSTRMKAGTAQKLVLNTISTVSMVRLGRTYGNLMVDVVASNAKLRARARRAVELATDVSDEEIDAALVAADGDAKVAIVSPPGRRRRSERAASGSTRPAASIRARPGRPTGEARRRGGGRRRRAAARRRRDRGRPDRRRRAERRPRAAASRSRASSTCR